VPIATRSADAITLTPDTLLKGAKRLEVTSALPGSTSYETKVKDDGIEYRFPKGMLAGLAYLTTDFLLEGSEIAVFLIKLVEGENGPEFGLTYSMLNQCQARLRLPLSAVDQNVWMLGREGALLKRICVGARVGLENVDRIRICLERHALKPSRWSMTPLKATKGEPALLEEPILPAGPLIDELGQSTLREWAGKTRSEKELADRLGQQFKEAAGASWPAEFSRWGGWTGKRFDASGFFRTQHDGRRWWMVDPEGYAFWSAGQDCVRMAIDAAVGGIREALKWLPEAQGPLKPAVEKDQVDFLTANFIRVFGERHHETWSAIALSLMKQYGFNTVANWSEWKIAQKAQFPYVRPMHFSPRRTKCIYRDFPDVFASTMEADAAEYAGQLKEHEGDRAFIGYFLMNEPTWGFASDTPAEGMLFNTESCATRDALAAHLRGRYGNDDKLRAAWGMEVTFERVRSGRWHGKVSDAAREDLTAFSTVMAERYFSMLSAACKRVDPNHLNLGARYYTVPPRWALLGMKSFDIFSINCYRQQVPADQLNVIAEATGKPTLIGEWHFGALDVGLPATGIGYVASQEDRGKAYRFYLENAAAISNCIGVHYFTLYDQSAIGRFDGENYNIGFLDICNRPYEPLCRGALESHRRMYAVADGKAEPFADAPTYYPPLFM
jgi:hypothetical protein